MYAKFIATGYFHCIFDTDGNTVVFLNKKQKSDLCPIWLCYEKKLILTHYSFPSRIVATAGADNTIDCKRTLQTFTNDKETL